MENIAKDHFPKHTSLYLRGIAGIQIPLEMNFSQYETHWFLEVFSSPKGKFL